jgi:2-amino-4-hydroxy-6-hydroxymethyldihydropteridine diphosphokinase
MADRAYIALGSNFGESVLLVRKAMERLQELAEGPIVRSSLWRTSPVDCPPGSPDFINAVVGIAPHRRFAPLTLLRDLQVLEAEFGRRPKVVLNEARPLDLDLILWGETVVNSPELIVPHPRALQRKFVLAPLAEIAPDLTFPGQEKPVRELLASLRTGEAIERI